MQGNLTKEIRKERVSCSKFIKKTSKGEKAEEKKKKDSAHIGFLFSSYYAHRSQSVTS